MRDEEKVMYDKYDWMLCAGRAFVMRYGIKYYRRRAIEILSETMWRLTEVKFE